MSMKNSNDTIGNRTRDLPACSAVPQPTAPPRTPLYTVHCTLYSVHCSLYRVQCALDTGHWTRYSVHCALWTVHCAQYSVQWKLLCTLALYTVDCALCTVHYALETVLCTLCTVHWTLCTVQCALYTVHSTLCTVHSEMYTVHCALPETYTWWEHLLKGTLTKGRPRRKSKSDSKSCITAVFFFFAAVYPECMCQSVSQCVSMSVFLPVNRTG